MRKTLSLAAAVAVAIATLGPAAPAQAANTSACVTGGEFQALRVGASRARVISLLDGKGTKVNSTTRRYKRCGSREPVYLGFDRPFTKKRAKVAAIRTARPAPSPAVKPPVQPPVKPPVQPPVKPPVQPPVQPPTPPVPSRPDPVTQMRSVVDTASCATLKVSVANQTRTNTWTWSGGTWSEQWSEWRTVSTAQRAATANDCINRVDVLSSDVLLPDLRIRNLDRCGAYDRDVTGGACFMIVDPAPYDPDYPRLQGKRLLKFPVITLNAGAGPSEVIADRSAAAANDWKAYQTFYRPNGQRESQVIPGVEFYYAGDGHNHWHFRDFDTYWIEDLQGVRVRTSEKHGYCVQDTTAWGGVTGGAPVPTAPVYGARTSCGAGLPNSLTIIQGLSRGWADTYDTSLSDQAIDITGLPDGRYRVGITADSLGAIREVDEANNTAHMEISLVGNTLTTYPSTASGGLD